MKVLKYISAMILLLLLTNSIIYSNYSDSTTLIILDCSISMNDHVVGLESKNKFEYMKKHINKLLSSASNKKVALMVFGSGSNMFECKDYKLIIEPTTDYKLILDKVKKLNPMSGTPIANTLEYANSIAKKYNIKKIMLFTDGIDSCNPKEVPDRIIQIRNDNIELVIIGISLESETNNIYKKIAKSTNSKYISLDKKKKKKIERKPIVKKIKKRNLPQIKPKKKAFVPKKIKLSFPKTEKKKVEKPTKTEKNIKPKEVYNKKKKNDNIKKVDNYKSDFVKTAKKYLKKKPIKKKKKIVPPKLTVNSSMLPDYPYAAKRFGIEGKVKLKILVGKRGKVEKVIVKNSSGSPILDDCAKKSAKRWKFSPAKVNGRYRRAYIYKTISFELESEDVELN